jgi:hypothetical protein
MNITLDKLAGCNDGNTKYLLVSVKRPSLAIVYPFNVNAMLQGLYNRPDWFESYLSYFTLNFVPN